jgi:hypothetical protein
MAAHVNRSKREIIVRRPIYKKSSFVKNPHRLVFFIGLVFTGGVMRLLIVEDDKKTSGTLKADHERRLRRRSTWRTKDRQPITRQSNCGRKFELVVLVVARLG